MLVVSVILVYFGYSPPEMRIAKVRAVPYLSEVVFSFMRYCVRPLVSIYLDMVTPQEVAGFKVCSRDCNYLI